MKKIELLAPAGNMECLHAAINAGCDAVYLSGKRYGARAYANNFNDDELTEAVNICHLYDVKIYVTVNTIVYEKEMNHLLNYVKFLHEIGVDAIIVQDLGAIDLIRQTYPNLEIHASTQANIHSLETVKVFEKLGVKRCVVAREMSIKEIENIKKSSDMEIEVFIQGALCISYSGQCLMSSLIGGRSGNRGTCTQCCRMPYDLIKNDKIINKDKYVLSTKDLCTLENIGKLIEIGVDSIKIEGRMKRKEYVYLAVSLYRKAIDTYLKYGFVNVTNNDIKNLKKIFNRGFTKGFLFNEENNKFTNPKRPNHRGIEIGKIIDFNNNYFLLKLSDNLNVQDGIRVIDDDIGFTLNEMFINNKKVKNAKSGDIVKIKKKIKSKSVVVKTTDYEQLKVIDNLIEKKKYLPLDIDVIAHLNKKVLIIAKYKDYKVSLESDYIVASSLKVPTKKEDVKDKINRLHDTVYFLRYLNIDIDDNIFIPATVLNNLRRDIIDILNNERIKLNKIVTGNYNTTVPDFEVERKKSILIDSDAIPNGFDEVYNYKDIKGTTLKLDRIIPVHKKINKRVLVSELGSINVYKDIVTDFSFNVTNSYTVALLHSLGVNKITLSPELTFNQIKNIVDSYHNRYNKHPNLEVIKEGYIEAMICKYNLDGEYIKDKFGNNFKIVIRNNYMYIYDYKKTNLKDDFYSIGINSVRINKEI